MDGFHVQQQSHHQFVTVREMSFSSALKIVGIEKLSCFFFFFCHCRPLTKYF